MSVTHMISAAALVSLACGAAAAQTRTSVNRSVSPSISQSVSPSVSQSVSPSVTGSAPEPVTPSTTRRTFAPQDEQAPGPDVEPRALNEARQPLRPGERDATFNRQGQIATPGQRRDIQRDLTVDRLRRSQRPGYSVGAGNDIIRRR